MPQTSLNPMQLTAALSNVDSTDLSYRRNRKVLFESIVACFTDDGMIVPREEWRSVKSALTAKQQHLGPDTMLALETALDSWLDSARDVLGPRTT